jgi:hypothetical protein
MRMPYHTPATSRVHSSHACPQVLQQPQYRGKALPADHPDSKLVQAGAEDC